MILQREILLKSEKEKVPTDTIWETIYNPNFKPLEFDGFKKRVWAQINNPDFKVVEFDYFKSQASLPKQIRNSAADFTFWCSNLSFFPNGILL